VDQNLYEENQRLRRKIEERDRSLVASVKRVWKYIALGLVGLAITFMLLSVVGREIGRWQRVRDANNNIYVIGKQVEQTKKLVEVEEQKALVRVAEAEGIAEAQMIIDSSLTQNYLTYEAIKAQQAMAGSPNDTVIYIPVGNNGIPLVSTVEQGNRGNSIGDD
jgi:hypothetical protein